MRYSPLIVWMDLEMTGLDPERDRILEIATVITDADLNVVEEGPDIVVHQPDEVLSRMDDWNVQHHGESGLTEKVRFSSISEMEAEKLTLKFISNYVDERVAPLAGNSIHQDRRFISRYMRKLDAYLHYRLIDVSSVKELARRWYPDIYEQAPEKKNAHRALDDVYESIKELQWFRERIFRPA